MTQILLLGDSLVADHDWQKSLPGYQVTNYGVPGAMSGDLLRSLPQIKVENEAPDIIVVMVGTNDLLTGNYEFLLTVKKVLIQLSKDFPMAEVVATSLFPMSLPHLPSNTVASLNTHLEAMTMQTGSCYLDIHRRFKDAKDPIFQEDGVHITAAGYRIWARGLLEHLAFLVDDE